MIKSRLEGAPVQLNYVGIPALEITHLSAELHGKVVLAQQSH